MDEPIIAKAENHEPLTGEDITEVVSSIFGHVLEPAQIAIFRSAVLTPDAPAETLASLVKALRSYSGEVTAPDGAELLNICCAGTLSPFDTSLAAGIAAAAGGASVLITLPPAPSGSQGQLDVLRTLGFGTELSTEHATEMVAETGAAFADPVQFCPVVRHLLEGADAPQIDFFRSAVAPLIFPAAPSRCYIGVGSAAVQTLVTETAIGIGFANGMIACGSGGEGEISMTGPTHVNELMNGRANSYDVTPEDNGIESCDAAALKTSTPKESAYMVRSVLSGKLKGPRREAVVLNAAAALMSSGKAGYFARGIMEIRNLLDNGKALEKLEQIKKKSNGK